MGSLVSVVGVLVICYLVGAIPFGFLIGKFHGLDIRRHGSGNIGATNVRRVIGRDWSIACFVLDFLKGLLPVLMALHISGQASNLGWLPPLAAGATVAGHIWPLYLRFKGGKGVSTTLGALLALVPLAVISAIVVWLVIFKLTRYVSAASVCAAVILPLSAVLWRSVAETGVPAYTLGLLVVIAVIIILRHRGNIQRLLSGREHRFKGTDRT